MDIKRSEKGFTLIELLLVVAIIGIVAGAIMVGISGQRESAQESRALAEMSAMIQPIMMCISDGNKLRAIDQHGESVLCAKQDDTSLSAYGTWPKVGEGSALSVFTHYVDNLGSASDWAYMIKSGAEATDVTICCNAKSLKCGNIPGDRTFDQCQALAL